MASSVQQGPTPGGSVSHLDINETLPAEGAKSLWM